jgi:hypothetical protein
MFKNVLLSIVITARSSESRIVLTKFSLVSTVFDCFYVVRPMLLVCPAAVEIHFARNIRTRIKWTVLYFLIGNWIKWLVNKREGECILLGLVTSITSQLHEKWTLLRNNMAETGIARQCLFKVYSVKLKEKICSLVQAVIVCHIRTDKTST